MHDEMTPSTPDHESPVDEPLVSSKRKSPGPLNAALLCTAVFVILGIYGFSIYQSSTEREEQVFTPTKPVRQPVASPAPNPTESLPKDAEVIPSDTPDTEPTEVVVTPEEVQPIETEDPALVEVVDSPIPESLDESLPTPPVVEEVAAVDEEEYLERGWKFEASDVLQAFLASTNAEERSRLVIEPGRVASILRAVDAQESLPWTGLSVDHFKHIDLSDNDRRKGIFLMLKETQAKGSEAPSERSYAFFKRTDEGLKLDLEVFLQTTGSSFQNFTSQPRPGTSRTFRVFITEDPTATKADAETSRTYIIAGLANFDSAIRVQVTRLSPIGRILEAANFKSDDGTRQVMRNATVELRWTDQPDNSAIELSRFLCWEFLGLGGEPMDDPDAPQW